MSPSQRISSRPPPPPGLPGPGDTIADKYVVERLLGVGGMGAVLAARHVELDERVAIKMLLPTVKPEGDPVTRFIREAKAAIKIRNEHVVRVLDVARLPDGSPYIVMEYLEGTDLSRLTEEVGPLPVEDAVEYVVQACEAIAAAHALGIVHRDLKPANLFLTRTGDGRPCVKVLDFGISKVPASENDQVVTQAAAIMGSPGYMSPEQMMSSKTVDVRSDIWSLGVVLYELLAHRLPFRGDTMPEVVAGILQRAPEPLFAVRADVPAGLQAVIDRCLEKDPARRFANVAELARAIAPFGPARSELHVERIEHLLGLVAEPMRPISAPPGPPGPSESRTFSPTTTQTGAGPSRFIVPGALLVIAGAAVVIAVALRAPKGGPTPATTGAAAAPSIVATAPPDPPPAAPSASTSASTTTLSALPPPTPLPGPQSATGSPRPLPPPPGPGAATAKPSTTPAPTPSCRIVSYFDADGNKHFKQECP